MIRHAQAEHHLGNLTGGWTDTGLTELGRRQSACLASGLRRELAGVPCRLYSSDLKRALETAEIIANEIGVTPSAVSPPTNDAPWPAPAYSGRDLLRRRRVGAGS